MAKKGYHAMRKDEDREWTGCMKPLREEDDEKTICNDKEVIFKHDPSKYKGCLRSTEFRKDQCDPGFVAMRDEENPGKYTCFTKNKDAPKVTGAEPLCKPGQHYLDPADNDNKENPLSGACML